VHAIRQHEFGPPEVLRLEVVADLRPGSGEVRIAVAAAVRHLIARRTSDASSGNLTQVELERRVTTLGQLLVRIAGAVIVVVAALMILKAFNVDIGPAIAGLGIAGLAVGFGYTGIIVAALARYHPLGVVPIAIFVGALSNAGTTLQSLPGGAVPSAIGTVLQGAILICVLASEIHVTYRLRWRPAALLSQ